MFKNPFSFSGRIRRLEYGLSWLAYPALILLILLLLLLLNISLSKSSKDISAIVRGTVGSLLLITASLLLVYFVIAQGTKRCHDLGRNGWWQIIPFYVFVLLFADGDHYENEYGVNPKYPEDSNNNFSEDTFGHFATKRVADYEAPIRTEENSGAERN